MYLLLQPVVHEAMRILDLSIRDATYALPLGKGRWYALCMWRCSQRRAATRGTFVAQRAQTRTVCTRVVRLRHHSIYIAYLLTGSSKTGRFPELAKDAVLQASGCEVSIAVPMPAQFDTVDTVLLACGLMIDVADVIAAIEI